ncbi:hypothetical protein SprV_ctg2102921000 [Sparganum proliferum]
MPAWHHCRRRRRRHRRRRRITHLSCILTLNITSHLLLQPPHLHPLIPISSCHHPPLHFTLRPPIFTSFSSSHYSCLFFSPPYIFFASGEPSGIPCICNPRQCLPGTTAVVVVVATAAAAAAAASPISPASSPSTSPHTCSSNHHTFIHSSQYHHAIIHLFTSPCDLLSSPHFPPHTIPASSSPLHTYVHITPTAAHKTLPLSTFYYSSPFMALLLQL